MGVADAAFEAIGQERFDGWALSLVGRRLRAGIGWYVGFGSSIEALIWDKDSDGRLLARSPVQVFSPLLTFTKTYLLMACHLSMLRTIITHLDRGFR